MPDSMSIKKILYFKYVSIVLLYVRFSFALFLNMFNHVSVFFFRLTPIDHRRHRTGHHMVHFKLLYYRNIAHVEFVFLLTINNSIIRTRC